MFDLDGTLINTKSGNKFPKTSKDWQWLPGVMDRLRELVRTDANALIVIVSNQKVSSTNEEKKKLVQNKIKDVFKTLVAELHDDARVCVYASTDADKYRKPSTGIFEDRIYSMARPGSEIIYVGDAAGRKQDFSDSDRKFAYNVQLFLNHEKFDAHVKFYTPEEYFQSGTGSTGGDEQREWAGFNPEKYMKDMDKYTDSGLQDDLDKVFDAPGYTFVVLLGPQAVGKSTFAKRHFVGEGKFAYFGLDEMPRKSNYDKAFEEFAETYRKKNYMGVVVDATNPSIVTRDRWLKHGSLFDNMFILSFPGSDRDDKNQMKEYLQHMNVVRARLTGEKEIPDVAYNMYYKKYQQPKNDEFPESLSGERDIIRIPIIPVAFPDKKSLMYFLQWS
jgi:bifunctional polynucleotide phosphatase/kinase